jgi:hypothetical protein
LVDAADDALRAPQSEANGDPDVPLVFAAIATRSSSSVTFGAKRLAVAATVRCRQITIETITTPVL